MANLEFIQKRIAGKEAEISRLEKKMDRILKAQATNWEKNPYWYSESDLRSTTKEIEAAKKALADYQDQLAKETEKANSRDIPAILEFLARWKERTMYYYKEEAFPRYVEALKEYYAYDKAYTEWSNNEGYRMFKENREEYNRVRKEHDAKQNKFRKDWAFISDLVGSMAVPFEKERKYFFDEEKFQKILDREANDKYDFIIERTNDIVGQITDASGLYIGSKGDLNGFIDGTRGRAKVQTISAEGPIQCFHYRTLIHKA